MGHISNRDIMVLTLRITNGVFACPRRRRRRSVAYVAIQPQPFLLWGGSPRPLGPLCARVRARVRAICQVRVPFQLVY